MKTNEADGPEEGQISRLLDRATQLFDERRYQESNKAYLALLERKAELGDIFPIYAGIAENYLWLGDSTEAKKWIARCLECAQSPNRTASAHARLAVSESLLHNPGAELEHCLAALPLFDREGNDYDAQDEYHVYTGLGELSLIKGDAAVAERYLREALAIHEGFIERWGMAQLPALPHTLCNLGGALLAQGKADEAVTVLKRALKCDRTTEDTFHIYSTLGGAYHDKSDFAMSASHLEQAIRHVDEGSKAAPQYYLLAVAYQYLGDHTKALRYFQACLDGKVNLRRGRVSYRVRPAEIYRLIGAEMYVLGQTQEGEEWYGRALEESQDSAWRRETMEWMAGSLAGCGETEKAVGLYQQCADLAECEAGKARIYFYIAVALWNAGKVASLDYS